MGWRMGTSRKTNSNRLPSGAVVVLAVFSILRRGFLDAGCLVAGAARPVARYDSGLAVRDHWGSWSSGTAGCPSR